MKISPKFAIIFIRTPHFFRRFTSSSARAASAEQADKMRRELYGMNRREQSAANHALAKAGQTVTVRTPTLAFSRQGTSCLLAKGSQVTISKHPLALDGDRNVQVILLNQRNTHLLMGLSDYVTAIQSRDGDNSQRAEPREIPSTGIASASPPPLRSIYCRSRAFSAAAKPLLC